MRKLFIFGVLIAALSTATLSTVGAEQPDLDTGESRSEAKADPIGDSDDGAEDGFEARSYAQEYGVTVSEAERRFEIMDSLRPALDTIIDGPDSQRLAGWGFDHDGEFTGWVSFAGESDVSVETRRIADRHTNLVIKVGEKYTLDELLRMAKEATRSVGESQELRSIHAFTDIDVVNNTVVIGMDSSSTRMRQISDSLNMEPTDAFAFVERSVPSPMANVWGGQVTTLLWGAEQCTSGFTVIKNGVRGMSTAAHCPNSLFQNGVYMAFEGGWSHPRRDVQWHTSTANELDNFHKTASNIADVKTVVARQHMMNDWICHYGRSSGRSCGVVTSIWSALNSNNNCGGLDCDNVWIAVQGSSLEACFGDSGGPFYKNRKAYGVLSATNSDPNDCSAFGPTFGSIFSVWFTSSTMMSEYGLAIATS